MCTEIKNKSLQITCKQCGTEFNCGATSDDKKCWCCDLPNTIPVKNESLTAEDCLCKACLEKLIEQKNMDSYDETIKTWNKIANLYEEKFMDLAIYNASYDNFLAALPKTSSTLLELGCGPGNITKYLLSKNQTLKITGTDVSQNMIDLAKKNNPTAKFELLDIRKLNQLNKNFDGIICGFALPYLAKVDCLQLILHSAERLNTNGIFYLSFVEGDYSNSGFISGSSGDRTFFYYYAADDIQTELEKNKFKILESFQVPFKKSNGDSEFHSILIAKKQ